MVVYASRPGKLRLVKLPTPPRDAPVATNGEQGIVFIALLEAHPTAEERALRKARNRTVDAWAAALARSGNGRDTLRAAERLEMKVWVIRHQVGEIDAQALHAGLSELVSRELVRLEAHARSEPPQASPANLREARAFLAREQLLAGQADSNYERYRRAHRDALAARIPLLLKLHPQEAPSAREDLAEFDVACPPEAELRAAAGLTEVDLDAE